MTTSSPFAPSPWTTPAPAPVAAPAPAPVARPGRTVALVLAAALFAGATGGAVGASVAGDGAAAPAADRGEAVVTRTALDASGSVSDVAAAVLPSVVSIAVRGREGSGSGSGVVLDDAGHVLTNDHVVASGVGGDIAVLLSDGRRESAEIVGRDPLTDLAVLRVADAEGLTPVELGSSQDVQVGDSVIAIGSPLGLSGTVTTGIVSALDRTVRTSPEAPLLGAVQTDAAINPGNSGGALVDGAGRLIGINTAISTTGQGGGSIGLGFAIPVDQARSIADEILRTGRATHPSLGVGATSVAQGDTRGALLQQVPADSAAAAAGLAAGDLVVAVEDTAVATVDELVIALRARSVGDRVTVTYLRDGDRRTAEVVLAGRSA